jgi:molybdopterin/thiamine biosynthesis adenylyltransferase
LEEFMEINKATHIVVIGGGGLGANLAASLANQGYNYISLYDDDVSDKKFLDRFAFFNGMRVANVGIPKTAVIERTIKSRWPESRIGTFHVKVDNNFNYEELKFKYVIVTVDSVPSREIIERNLRLNHVDFIHVGCNLNSISIFNTIEDVWEDPQIAGATTSYDSVPDANTYMMACVQTISFLENQKIRIFIESEEDQIQQNEIPSIRSGDA